MSLLITLTPAESKRLIGRALAVHPLVRKAMKHGNILVSNGTTTGYFIQELLGIDIDICKFPSGVVTQGVQCQTPDDRIRSVFIKKGELIKNNPAIETYEELNLFFREMGAGDLYIKGANALDSSGNAGFLLAHPDGGNVMMALHKVYAQGVRFLIPMGLEKLVASVPDAQRNMQGIHEYSYTTGRGCGYVMVSNGIIIHEIEALKILTGVDAWHVASGGIGGSEGAVSLVIKGSESAEAEAVELIESIKGEPALPVWKKKCAECTFRCRYRFQSNGKQ